MIDADLIKVCNDAETRKYLANLDLFIEPMPVKLKAGEKIKVSFDAELLKPIPVGSQLKVDMTLGGSHLPCMDVTVIIILKKPLSNSFIHISIP